MKVVLISPYGLQGRPSKPTDSGLNKFARQLAQSLVRCHVNVSVIAQNDARRQHVESDGQVQVHCVFRRGSLLAPWTILNRSLRIPFDIVHFQHELFAYGGVVSGLVMPVVLRLLRTRKPIVSTIHGVIPLDRIDARFIRSNQIKGPTWAVVLAWKTLLRLIAGASDIVHVHEAEHKEWLVRQYGIRKRIIVVPHGMDAPKPRGDRRQARATLNLAGEDEVALFFGYLAAYKGISEFIGALRTAQERRPKLKVLIAGSVPSRLAGTFDPHRLMKSHGVDSSRVSVLGFVAESDISTVLRAADVMVLPYTTAMAASGPMATALTHRVPVLLSTAFSSVFPQAPGMFSPTTVGIADAVCAYFSEPSLREAVRCFGEGLVEGRCWDAVADRMRGIYEVASR